MEQIGAFFKDLYSFISEIFVPLTPFFLKRWPLLVFGIAFPLMLVVLLVTFSNRRQTTKRQQPTEHRCPTCGRTTDDTEH